jgi:hypothetical protein
LIQAFCPTTDTKALTEIRILALTRDASSATAKKLAEEPHVSVVQGDLNHEESIRKIFEDAKSGGEQIWGVFAVLAYPGLGANADGEEKQGKVGTAAEFSFDIKG